MSTKDIKEVLKMYNDGLLTVYEVENMIVSQNSEMIKECFEKNEPLYSVRSSCCSRERLEPIFGMFQKGASQELIVKLSLINIIKLYWNKLCFFANKDSWQFKYSSF